MLQAEIHKTNKFLETYPQFKAFLKEVAFYNPVIVFGSFAKLAASKNSDADILAVSEKELKLPSHMLPNKIHLINLSESSFLESLKKQESFIKEIEENHVILNNHSFYVDAMWNYYGT
ncbi:MAG: nucleotidyltransferase domain-containing protein [Candidatus Aenigmarchaeota archaeon]|nr:nucleotidyltransferase domain-containing protein [Candidatus Aenigmarchaeota archaeon]